MRCGEDHEVGCGPCGRAVQAEPLVVNPGNTAWRFGHCTFKTPKCAWRYWGVRLYVALLGGPTVRGVIGGPTVRGVIGRSDCTWMYTISCSTHSSFNVYIIYTHNLCSI